MRLLFTSAIPPIRRILLVESGPRSLTHQLLPRLYQIFGQDLVIDLLTCYPEPPTGLTPASTTYNVNDFRGNSARLRLVRQLRRGRYDAAGIICARSPILATWKWLVLAAVPAKGFIANENTDFFWADTTHRTHILRSFLSRSPFSAPTLLRSVLRVCLFPFAFLYLLLYAATIQVKRKVHS
jgi:hypothetical protein